MEILRIKVYLTDHIVVEGHADTAVMLPFTGECDSPIFKGKILSGGVDTQRVDKQGRCKLSARYTLEGVDCDGVPCKLFIQNEGVSLPGGEMHTHPIFRTDSKALSWLETADLTGRIEHVDGHIEIVLSSEDKPGVRRFAIQRAGLTLRGVLEKPVDGPAPLVIMCHGFAARMDAFPGGFFQAWSDALTAAGFATLRFDFNGHGDSEGRFQDMTVLSEIEDAAAMLRYALSLPDVTEIYVLGHSQGGVVAGMLSGYYHDVVKKLVMLCPATSLKQDALDGTCMGVTYDPEHIPETVQLGPNTLGGLYFRIAQTLPIYEVTRQFTGPALALIGGQDNIVHAEDIRKYGEIMPCCQVTEWATLDHGLGGAEQQQAVEQVVEFLKG